MQCECPDYKARKEACKHLFAAMLFVNNKGKQTIENLERQDWLTEMINTDTKDIVSTSGQSNGQRGSIDVTTSDKPTEAPTKPLDRQSTITRLAVLNTATEILKTHSKPIEFHDIVSLAAQLEKWALGN